MRTVISTTVDDNYLGYVYCLAKSIAVNSPLCDFHIKLIDISNKNKVSQIIKNICDRFILEFIDTGLCSKPMLTKRKGKLLLDDLLKGLDTSPKIDDVRHNRWLISKRQCYTSNIRFRNIFNLLDHYQYIVYLDADTIVNKEIDDFNEKFNAFDISSQLLDDNTFPNNHSWQCSFIGMKSNSLTKAFTYEVMTKTEKDMYFWDSDQFQFEYAYQKYNSQIAFNFIGDDIECRGDTVSTNQTLDMNSYLLAGTFLNKTHNVNYINLMKQYCV